MRPRYPLQVLALVPRAVGFPLTIAHTSCWNNSLIGYRRRNTTSSTFNSSFYTSNQIEWCIRSEKNHDSALLLFAGGRELMD